MNNLMIAVTLDEYDSTLGLPYTEANLQILLSVFSLKRECSWRGVPTFTHTNKKIHFAIVKESDIATIAAVSPEET